MRTLSVVLNALIFIATLVLDILLFRKEGKWSLKDGRASFRFFTIQSNTLCGFAAMLMVFAGLRGAVPPWILLLKYLGTAAVTVTLLTVFFFLAPTQGGLKPLLEGGSLYYHLLGPLLAIVSWCFLEKGCRGFGYHLLGLIPTALYGILYLRKVVFVPEAERWEDFYGFNRGGKWKVGFSAMIVGTLVICVLLWII